MAKDGFVPKVVPAPDGLRTGGAQPDGIQAGPRPRGIDRSRAAAAGPPGCRRAWRS